MASEKVSQDVAFVRQPDNPIGECRDLHELRLLAQDILREASVGKIRKCGEDVGKPGRRGVLRVEGPGNTLDDVPSGRHDSRGLPPFDGYLDSLATMPVGEHISGCCKDSREIPSTFDLNWGSFGGGLIDTRIGEAEGTTPRGERPDARVFAQGHRVLLPTAGGDRQVVSGTSRLGLVMRRLGQYLMARNFTGSWRRIGQPAVYPGVANPGARVPLQYSPSSVPRGKAIGQLS